MKCYQLLWQLDYLGDFEFLCSMACALCSTTAMQKYFFTLEKGFVTLTINVSPEWLLLKNTTVLWFSKGSIPKIDQGIVLTHR